jgi:hypothetical protein
MPRTIASGTGVGKKARQLNRLATASRTSIRVSDLPDLRRF